jgi:C4-dicarboxylate-specific signal transduction histidine kinase
MLERIERGIGNMRIRLKLMVFHNVFFCLLAFTIYLSIIPVLEKRLDEAYQRETQLLRQALTNASPVQTTDTVFTHYEPERGTAPQLGMPEEVRTWVDEHPGAVWHNPEKSAYLYHKDRSSSLYMRVKLPKERYREMVSAARWAVTLVLIATYLLGVIVLEFFVLPLYVYRPIHLLLKADRASTSGDLTNELVPESSIPDDELGDLMWSRNETIRSMREQEQQLASALGQLQQATDDLTTRNRQLETARQNLLDQDRLASLGLISASVAHELNTPLAVLKGSIQKLLEEPCDATTHGRLQRMERVTNRLQSISAQLLGFAAARRDDTMPVCVRELIEECWELVSIDDKAARVKFVNEAGADDWVCGNPDRLGQVFVNLLRNALHEITDAGSIWVRSSRLPGQPSRIAVRVEDDGPGIPESLLPQLFEAFVSTRLDSQGTGLGLTVAAGIIQQHNGSIRAFNREAGGACLEVELPAAERKDQEPAAFTNRVATETPISR